MPPSHSHTVSATAEAAATSDRHLVAPAAFVCPFAPPKRAALARTAPRARRVAPPASFVARRPLRARAPPAPPREPASQRAVVATPASPVISSADDDVSADRVAHEAHATAAAATSDAAPPPVSVSLSLQAAIKTAADVADFALAVALYNRHEREHAPNARLLTTLVGRLTQTRAGCPHAAMLLSAASPPADSPHARVLLISALARHDGPDAALAALQALPRSLWSAHACTTVIHALGVAARVDDAAAVLRTAVEVPAVVPDAPLYNAVMRALGRAGRVRQSFEVLAEMRARAIQPTDVTFQALIFACTHAREEDRVRHRDSARRACIVYDAAVADGLATPRVLSAFASVVLRKRIWFDWRVGSLVRAMEDALVLSDDELRIRGVTVDRFLCKMDRLCRLTSYRPPPEIAQRLADASARNQGRQKPPKYIAVPGSHPL